MGNHDPYSDPTPLAGETTEGEAGCGDFFSSLLEACPFSLGREHVRARQACSLFPSRRRLESQSHTFKVLIRMARKSGIPRCGSHAREDKRRARGDAEAHWRPSCIVDTLVFLLDWA
jgi:hypothetical protein